MNVFVLIGFILCFLISTIALYLYLLEHVGGLKNESKKKSK